MQEGEHRRDRHLELVAQRDEGDDRSDRDEEGDGGRPHRVGAPVGADGGDGVVGLGKAERLGGLGRMGVGGVGVRGVGTDEEARLALARGRLDRGVGFIRRRERVAHLGDRDVAGGLEVDLGAAAELDAKDQAADYEPQDREHAQHGGYGQQRAAVADEVDLVCEVATHGPHPPSRHAHPRAPQPPPGRA